VRSIRATLRQDLVDRFAVAVDRERTAQVALTDTDDFREGVAASLERRPPRFTGR
jgi:enoyl-CoA hydratase/carnithine racemase